MANDFLTLIKTRRSIRAYKPDAVPADVLARLDAMTESLKEKLPHCPDLFAQGEAARVW